jgi:hypothetical protein
MNSRRLMPNIGTPSRLGAAWPVYRTPTLLQRGWQVLGANLNCSESRRAVLTRVLPPKQYHAVRRKTVALRDFSLSYVRIGSKPVKRTLAANSGHRTRARTRVASAEPAFSIRKEESAARKKA